jgi:hypothetical protein
MFPIDIFLTKFGYSIGSMNVFEFAQKHKEKLLKAIRIDKFDKGSSGGQILGEHVFYLIFSDPQNLCKLFVLGCDTTSGYMGSGPTDFKTLMDWVSFNEIDIVYYSVHSDDEHFQFWGSELDEFGDSVPSANGAHRNHGPNPWDYGDKFVQHFRGISLEEYKKLGRDYRDTKQQLYSNTLDFLLESLDSGTFLRSI